jgi:tetratricopeptide (TPR) repeat protein
LCIASPALAGNQASTNLLSQGDDDEMNLRLDRAITRFQQAAAASPDDPAAYRALAAAYFFKIVFARGAVTIDEFLDGDTRDDRINVAKPAADLAAAFHMNADRALSLGEQAAASRPNEADAHFQLGATIAMIASYSATVDGQIFEAFKLARRAYKEEMRTLELDPRRQDAALIVGLYEYIVSMRSLPVRWMARISGLADDKSHGIAQVETAARYPGDTQTDARMALLLIYNRERRYDDALAVLSTLQARYPNNRLLWLETGATMLRAGRYQDAKRTLDEGFVKFSAPVAAQKPAPARGKATARPARGTAREPVRTAAPEPPPVPMFGEEALWRYKRGAALVCLRLDAEATRDLAVAVQKDARDWVHDRAHTELGKLADLRGDRRVATDEYRVAIQLAKTANDSSGLAEAEHWLSTPYRR